MKDYRLKLGKQEFIVKPSELAEQANGSAVVHYGDTVVLGTATMSEKERDDLDFFPLTVEYEEKFYAAGKILGSRFSKREGRPSDIAIVTARLIDRSIRPRFNKELKRDVQVIGTCLSWDAENDPDIITFMASSISLMLSDIPWKGPLAAVRVARKESEFIINPTYQEREESDIDIFFSGFENEQQELIVNMIEAGAEEVDEETFLKALSFAEKYMKEICCFQKMVASEIGKQKIEIKQKETDSNFENEIKSLIQNKVKETLSQKEKSETSKKMKETEQEIVSHISEKYPDDEKNKIKQGFNVLEKEISETIKENIFNHETRPDGRKLNELRELKAEANLLPRTHGSALFGRGQTKSLSILTLGPPGDHQLLEGMNKIGEKRFLHHYNFPPYSVGEVKPLRGPSRRDIGHGSLAEKALFPVIPRFEDFPYTIRIVSEIVSSNGSTSMASVSSSSLALMDAGVPIKKPVAGISIGVMEKEKENKLLVDIQGIEDHHGGMDLKVAGTEDGITAVQMDVKIEGINQETFKKALSEAKIARFKILDKMKTVLNSPREKLSSFAPRVAKIQINPDKIREVIGPGGKIINEIIDETGATIDNQDSGVVFVTSEKKEAVEKAVEWVKNIAREVEVGETFKGKVKRIMDFGCFVEILPGQEGLVHISKLSDKRVEKVKDIVDIGQIISVKVIGIDEQGRINLSMKDAQNHN